MSPGDEHAAGIVICFKILHFCVRILYNFKLNLSYTTPWGHCACPDPSEGIWKMKNIHLTNFFSQSEKKKGPISTDVSVFFLVIESSVITYTNTYRYVKKTPPKKEKTAPNKWFSLVWCHFSPALPPLALTALPRPNHHLLCPRILCPPLQSFPQSSGLVTCICFTTIIFLLKHFFLI